MNKKKPKSRGLGYMPVAFLGALLGLNLAITLFRLDETISFVGLNLLGEGLSMMLIGGFIYDLVLGGRKTSIFVVPIIASIGGGIWEILSFGVGFIPKKAVPIITEWMAYGFPAIVFIGLPVLFLTQFIRKEKKIWGIKTTNSTGLAFMFFSAMILTGSIIYVLVNHTGIFDWASSVVS